MNLDTILNVITLRLGRHNLYTENNDHTNGIVFCGSVIKQVFQFSVLPKELSIVYSTERFPDSLRVTFHGNTIAIGNDNPIRIFSWTSDAIAKLFGSDSVTFYFNISE